MNVELVKVPYGELKPGDLFVMESTSRTAERIARDASTPLYIRGTGDVLGTQDFPVRRVVVTP